MDATLRRRAETCAPEGLSDKELHAKAWKIVEPHFQRRRRIAEAEFPQVHGTGRASTDLEEVVRAALDGRVNVLFVAMQPEVWARVDANTRQLEIHAEPKPGDQDLIDLAATQTLLKEGMVYAADPDKVPGHGRVAAIYRW